MPPIENRPFDALQVGDEERLVHTLTEEDFSLLATQAATIGSGVVDRPSRQAWHSPATRRRAVGPARS
jgi:hypothetical protein